MHQKLLKKLIHKESKFFGSRCFVMISCKSATSLSTWQCLRIFWRAYCQKYQQNQQNWHLWMLCLISRFVTEYQEIPSTIKKSPTAFKNCSAVKLEKHVEFLGALLICWKTSSTPRWARYSIVSSKLFFTVHFFLTTKQTFWSNFGCSIFPWLSLI